MPFRLGDSGLTLIEILVAAGVVSLLGLAVASLSQLSTRANKTGMVTAESISISNLLNRITSIPELCNEALGGGRIQFVALSPPPALGPQGELPAVINASPINLKGNTIIQTDPAVQGRDLMVRGIVFDKILAILGPKSALVNLRIDLERVIPGGALGGSRLSYNYPFPVSLDGANRIAACDTGSSGSSSVIGSQGTIGKGLANSSVDFPAGSWSRIDLQGAFMSTDNGPVQGLIGKGPSGEFMVSFLYGTGMHETGTLATDGQVCLNYAGTNRLCAIRTGNNLSVQVDPATVLTNYITTK